VGAVVSDTPRTTALDSGGISDMKVGGSYYAMRELARSLERENAQLREALKQIATVHDTECPQDFVDPTGPCNCTAAFALAALAKGDA
jgi:hypothetical protein